MSRERYEKATAYVALQDDGRWLMAVAPGGLHEDGGDPWMDEPTVFLDAGLLTSFGRRRALAELGYEEADRGGAWDCGSSMRFPCCARLPYARSRADQPAVPPARHRAVPRVVHGISRPDVRDRTRLRPPPIWDIGGGRTVVAGEGFEPTTSGL